MFFRISINFFSQNFVNHNCQVKFIMIYSIYIFFTPYIHDFFSFFSSCTCQGIKIKLNFHRMPSKTRLGWNWRSQSPVFNTLFLICRSAVFSFGLFSLLVLELRWSGAKPPAGGRLHSSSFQQPCSSLAFFVAHSVVGLGDCRLSWPEPRAAASNNFNVNFPFILCVKLLLVWRWPPALWGQVLKSDVRLSGRQCAEIDRGVGEEV